MSSLSFTVLYCSLSHRGAGAAWRLEPAGCPGDRLSSAAYPAPQNEQLCAAAKSVVTCDCSGTSDSTVVPLNGGHGSARDDGLPVPAKRAQSVRMLAASACWSAVSVTGVAGRSNR